MGGRQSGLVWLDPHRVPQCSTARIFTSDAYAFSVISTECAIECAVFQGPTKAHRYVAAVRRRACGAQAGAPIIFSRYCAARTSWMEWPNTRPSPVGGRALGQMERSTSRSPPYFACSASTVTFVDVHSDH